MLLQKEREDVVKYCQMLITHGLTKGTGGNISILNREEGLFAISPSGIDYFETEPEDIVVMNLKGEIVDGDRKPSSEHELHRIFYTDRDDIAAVVHTLCLQHRSGNSERRPAGFQLSGRIFWLRCPLRRIRLLRINGTG